MAEQSTSLNSAGSSSRFLEPAPPPWIARALAYLLFVTFATLLVLSIVLPIPETVSGRFSLVPVRGADPVKAPRSGIVAEVRVVDGQSVKAGEELLRIRSELAGDKASEAETLEIQLRGNDEKLNNMQTRHESQARADGEEERSLRSKLGLLQGQVTFAAQRASLTKELADRYDKLYKSKIVGWEQSTAHQLEASQAGLSLSQVRVDIDQTRSQLEKLRYDMKGREADYLEAARALREDTARARVRLEALKQNPVMSRGNELTVLSPCAGSVYRLLVKSSGAVVREGDTLSEISCAADTLQADVSIPDGGVGLVKVGQPVKLYYDAFPYQRHGVRYGTVRWLGPAGSGGVGSGGVGSGGVGSGTTGTPAFRALVELKSAPFVVSGQAYGLMAGMVGRADVMVGSRSPISYAFEPIRQLRENFAAGEGSDPRQERPATERH